MIRIKNPNIKNSYIENGSKSEYRKIEQRLLSLVPELPSFLDDLNNKIGSLDAKQPQTFIADMKKNLDQFEEKLEGRRQRIGRFLLYIFGKFAPEINAKGVLSQVIEFTKREASVDNRYSLLLKLMHKADEKVPLISMIVPLRHGDPLAYLPRQCAPVDLLQQAEQERAEARATTALRVLAATSEFLYKPYLITIWSLSYFEEGKIPPQPPEFGDLVKAAHRRLSRYPGLVEPDAAWMRNSATHNLPEYLIDEDSLVLWDRKHMRVKIRVNDLLSMTRRMYQISAVTIHRVGQLNNPSC